MNKNIKYLYRLILRSKITYANRYDNDNVYYFSYVDQNKNHQDIYVFSCIALKPISKGK